MCSVIVSGAQISNLREEFTGISFMTPITVMSIRLSIVMVFPMGSVRPNSLSANLSDMISSLGSVNSRGGSPFTIRKVNTSKRAEITSADFEILLDTYKELNLIEKHQYITPAIHGKSVALANAILRSSSFKHLALIRDLVKTIRLSPSSRNVVLALLKIGNIGDIKLILNRFEKNDDKVDFWNHTELGRTVARKMAQKAKRIPEFLIENLERKEFWTYIPREERIKLPKKHLLPIKKVDNRSLYLRLVAYAMIGAANENDLDRLIDLTNHNYSLIASTAMIRLIHLMGDDAFPIFCSKVDESIKRGLAESYAEASRSAEIEFYGVASLW